MRLSHPFHFLRLTAILLYRNRFLCLRFFLHSGQISIYHRYRFFRTPGLAHPAADALLLIDHMHRMDFAGDRVNRADLLTDIDAETRRRINECLWTSWDIVEDRTRRTFLDAETTNDALAVVDASEIIVYLDGIHRASPDADSTSNASNLTLFLNVNALVPAVAADNHGLRGLGQLDDLFWTSSYALSASRALNRIYDRQVVGAHRDRIERTGAHAGPESQASVLT